MFKDGTNVYCLTQLQVLHSQARPLQLETFAEVLTFTMRWCVLIASPRIMACCAGSILCRWRPIWITFVPPLDHGLFYSQCIYAYWTHPFELPDMFLPVWTVQLWLIAGETYLQYSSRAQRSQSSHPASTEVCDPL